MFTLCYLYSKVVESQDGGLLAVAYADNWEVVAPGVSTLQTVLQAIEVFLHDCELPVSPQKCWTWALDKVGRQALRALTLDGAALSVQLQGVDLGADVAYSYRIPAAKRNKRVRIGHKRLQRLRGLPSSRAQKARLVVSGVWPQALHAAETAPVPKTVLKRLRTQAGRAASLAKTGVNPFLACSVGATQCIDPGYYVLCQRVRLFRQLWKDFPGRRSALLGSLAGTGRYRSVIKCCLLQLRALGWDCDGLLCSHVDGRHFHLRP